MTEKVDPARRAVVYVGEETLRSLMLLPDGMRLLAVTADPRRNAVELHVAHPDLEPVPEGHYAPALMQLAAAVATMNTDTAEPLLAGIDVLVRQHRAGADAEALGPIVETLADLVPPRLTYRQVVQVVLP